MNEAILDARTHSAQARSWSDASRLAVRGLGVALLVLVLALTLSDEVVRPQFMAGQDKVEHVLAFLALAFAFALGASLWAVLSYGLALSGVAFAIEFLQEIVTTTREGGLNDALAGCVGVVLGLGFALVINQLVAALMQRTSSRALAH